MADTAGRRKVVVVGTSVLALSCLGFALSLSWEYFLVASLLYGASSFYFSALYAVIADSVPQAQLMRALLLYAMAEHLPYSVSPLIGGFLWDLYAEDAVRITFLATSAAVAFAALARRRLLETLPRTKTPSKKELATSFVNTLSAFKSLTPSIKWLIAIRTALLISSVSMFYTFGVLYAMEVWGLLGSSWGAICALSSLAHLLAIPLLPTLERAGLRAAYPALLALQACSMLVFSLGGFFPMLAGSVMLTVLGACAYTVERALVAVETEKELRARAESLMILSYSVGGSLGSAIGGCIYQLSPQSTFWVAAALQLVGALCAAAFVKPKQQAF